MKMNLKEIKNKAINMGLSIAKKATKIELIHAIQATEGNTACYGTNEGNCPYQNCLWIADCGKK